MHEIESLDALAEVLADGRTSLQGLRIQGVDLAPLAPRLAQTTGDGAVLLGCTAPPQLLHLLVRSGALVFPVVPGLPFDPYRVSLYSPDDLYAGLDRGYTATSDATTYAWYRAAVAEHDMFATLLMALHDHSIDDALADHLSRSSRPAAQPRAGGDVVGVMGGHALQRGEPGYRDAAEMARTLTRAGRMVATGGGPGAMEAANLGAWLAPHPDNALGDALTTLAASPGYADDIGAWATAALAVRSAWPDGGASTGIPTWHYGHEPPNAFATHVAKFFRNALREDVLLSVCRGGVVFLPGAAGTVQEIFADATDNYYGDEPALMVLVGGDYWRTQLPAWPLLETLAAGRRMKDLVVLVDSVDEAAEALMAAGTAR